MASPLRQPFASLDSPRIRNLANLKNRQNAMPTTLSSPVKRRYTPPTIFDDVDSENVDPSTCISPKRPKNSDGLTSKKSQFILTAVPSTPMILKKSSETRPSSASSIRLDSPRSLTSQKRKTSPTTVTPAAGRSPKSKRVGLLSRRRTSSSPFTRIDPPSRDPSTPLHDSSLPFSIDAALSGTIPSYTARSKIQPLREIQVPTLDEAMPKGWIFDIHEDTIEDEMANIMEHSTCTLDISDDESRRAAKDERGKENIPPLEQPSLLITTINNALNEATQAPSTMTVQTKSRRNMQEDMMERSPLGDLPAAEFYADGFDASSHVIIQAAPAEKSIISREAKDLSYVTPARPRINPLAVQKDERKEFLARIEEAAAGPSSAPTFSSLGVVKQGAIEIWESGSGDEAEAEDDENEDDRRLSKGSEAMFSMENDAENTNLSAVGKTIQHDSYMA
ncbi:MAG: hypothetical protein M1827_000364 [Pycnora praestabilis]|nr:MAG: hypothetical protein M1827_000364 [Pycnora praestabilis]